MLCSYPALDRKVLNGHPVPIGMADPEAAFMAASMRRIADFWRWFLCAQKQTRRERLRHIEGIRANQQSR
jgi:hypothetical protein